MSKRIEYPVVARSNRQTRQTRYKSLPVYDKYHDHHLVQNHILSKKYATLCYEIHLPTERDLTLLTAISVISVRTMYSYEQLQKEILQYPSYQLNPIWRKAEYRSHSTDTNPPTTSWRKHLNNGNRRWFFCKTQFASANWYYSTVLMIRTKIVMLMISRT